MKNLLLLFFLLHHVAILHAQTAPDSTQVLPPEKAADDPSQFFTRAELFSELQHHQHNGLDFYLNQTTLRAIVKIGNRFTTRLDVPFVYNSFSSEAGYKQFGLSDISFRLLGYKFLESKRSAITASIEISLNTAQSPLIGSGKNIILPVVSYTTVVKPKRMLFAFIFQEAISFSGDEAREPISFSKMQPIFLNFWSAKVWTVVAPELYIDYIHGGASMNLEGRIVYAPVKRINVWAQGGTGIFGDFLARYQWGTEIGCRYFFLRDTVFKRKNNSG